MKTTYNLAREVAKNLRSKQGKYHDLKIRGIELQVGNKVIVKVVACDGKHRIVDRWEKEPSIVTVHIESFL